MKIFYSLISVLLSLFLAGCQEQSKVQMPQSRPLASDYKVFEAPPEPIMEPNENFIIDEPNDTLTLKDAAALTLLHNPVLKSYSWEIRAAEARQLQAGLWPNPTLDIGVENIISGFGLAETTIQLVQIIELGNKANKRKQAASIDQQLSGWDYETKRLEVFTNAGKSYFELLALQEKIEILSELVKISEASYESVAKRADAGKDSPIEKTKASIALSMVRLEYKEALQDAENAKKTMVSFWGSEEPKFKHAAGDLGAVSDVPEISVLKEKIAQSPQVARWENQIARGKAALELEKAKVLPDISLGGGGTNYNETGDTAFLFGISIPLPIFNRNQGGKLEAEYNISKSYELQKAARIEVMNQFNRIYTDLSISSDKIKEYRTSILPGAREVFNASQTAYVEGKIDYLNVLDAQRTYFLAQTGYIETLVSYHKAKTDIEGLVGESIESITAANNLKEDKNENESL